MVVNNLDKNKYNSVLIVIEKDGKWKFGDKKSVDLGNALQILKAYDFAFIAMHGTFGEDGRIQALLEWANIPYSGSGVLGSAMAMDKEISNERYKAVGLNVPRYVILKDFKSGIKVPVVVKPVDGGSSVGVSIVKAKVDFKRAMKKAFGESSRIMVQEFIRGRELTCGVLEDKFGKPFALPPTEIIPKTSAFFDYKAKYTVGGSMEITPVRLSSALTKKLQRMALEAHRALGCGGMSRSDFILKGTKFYILETNTIPGMTKTSLLPQAAKAAGINFSSMLDLIIKAGLRRSRA